MIALFGISLVIRTQDGALIQHTIVQSQDNHMLILILIS